MFTKKQLDLFFDFSYRDLDEGIKYWQGQPENEPNRDNQLHEMYSTRHFLDVSRRNMKLTGKDRYELLIDESAQSKQYINASIQLVMSILAFGSIKFINRKKPTRNDSENIPAGSTELAHQVEEPAPDSVVPVDSDSSEHYIVSSELPTGD